MLLYCEFCRMVVTFTYEEFINLPDLCKCLLCKRSTKFLRVDTQEPNESRQQEIEGV